jgi:hypothetical protein
MPKKEKKTKKVSIKDLKPYDKKKLNINYKKYPDQNFYAIRYEGEYSREQIQKFAQSKSNSLHNRKPTAAMFAVVLKFENGKWLSGKFTKPGDPVDLWVPYENQEDYGSIIAFDLLVSLPQ